MRELGLGTAFGSSKVSLATARERAARIRDMLWSGRDPAAERAAEKAQKAEEAARVATPQVTFKVAAQRYMERHDAAWRSDKHREQWAASLRDYVYPTFDAISVATISKQHVTDALQPIWTKMPVTASRVRGRIEMVLNFAVANGWRPEGPNPAVWKGGLEHAFPPRARVARVQHHAALDWRQIGAFMADLQAQDGIGAYALRLVVLTAARASEVIRARWDEIDLPGKVWIIPGERMKAGKEHRIPLNDSAIAVLNEMAKLRDVGRGDWIFPGRGGRKPLNINTMLQLLERMEVKATVHGMRSTFRDWAGETGQPADIAEAALAHQLGGKVQQAYQRGDLLERRRRLMAAWAEFCAKPAADVVQLRTAIAAEA
jgi:integrase